MTSCQSVGTTLETVSRHSLGRKTHQKHHRHIEQECNSCVCQKSETTNSVDICHRHVGNLAKQADNAVHKSASRSVVVEGNEGVHLEFGGAEKSLDHNQSDSLKDDATTLVQESSQDELDFTKRGDNDTNDDEGDVAESLHIWWCNPKTPGCNKDSYGGCGLVSNRQSRIVSSFGSQFLP